MDATEKPKQEQPAVKRSFPSTDLFATLLVAAIWFIAFLSTVIACFA